MTNADILEIVTRGAAAGVNFVVFVQFTTMFRLGWAPRLGALFTFATGVWVLYSSPQIQPVFGLWEPAGYFFAVFNSVFFWWFASALFDDNFRWRAWRFTPFALIAVLQLIRLLAPQNQAAAYSFFLHQPIVILMMGHALYLALSALSDDLVEERRRFRIVFASVVAVTGIAISIFEIADWFAPVTEKLSWLQSIAIFLPTLVFSYWLLSLRQSLFAVAPPPPIELDAGDDASPDIPARDRPIFERLVGKMNTGAYRREGLTVALLADQVNVPEHVLRRMINQQLGHRNFTAFLNEWRVRDAQKVLSDPEKARLQVIQVALSVGYGSVGPFNRAFKNATGLTPTEFRKKAIGEP